MFTTGVPDMVDIYPEYCTDPNIAICPSDPDIDESGINETTAACYLNNAETSWSYGYNAWAIKAEDVPASGVDANDTTVDWQGAWSLVPAVNQSGPTGNTGAVPAGTYNPDFALAYNAMATAIMDYGLSGGSDAVWEDDMSSGNFTGYRLREGIERFFISDINNPAASAQAQSEVAVMFDHMTSFAGGGGAQGGVNFNHIPGGSNILFMDGHVEFIKYPGDHPVTAAMAATVAVQ
jgi:prepilin-type processing-associated H-X9-DG protein